MDCIGVWVFSVFHLNYLFKFRFWKIVKSLIYRTKPSIPYSPMKEDPYTGELGCFTAYMRTNLPHAAICQKRTPYNRSPAESPLHFADRRAESVIMGYYTLPEVYAFLKCKKSHANTLTVRTWDLMLPRPNRVLITNAGKQLLCHFSKTVLRTSRMYLKSRKFSLFLNTAGFCRKKPWNSQRILRLFALNPACVCKISVLFFVFRYILA